MKEHETVYLGCDLCLLCYVYYFSFLYVFEFLILFICIFSYVNLLVCDKGAVGMIGAEDLCRAASRAVDENLRAAFKGCRVEARDAGRDADLRQI